MKRLQKTITVLILPLLILILAVTVVTPAGGFAQTFFKTIGLNDWVNAHTRVVSAQTLTAEVLDFLDRYYIEKIDKTTLATKSIEDILATLGDPYTAYLEPEEYQQFLESLKGTFSGVGVQIEKVGADIKIVAALRDTPAERVGLFPGDIILAVGEQTMTGASLEAALVAIKGKPGTEVILTIQRDQHEPFNVKLKREVISVPGVEWAVHKGRIGYLRLNGFNERTEVDFTNALAALKRQKVKGLVLDLRDNPGGLLDSAVAIASKLLPPGPVVQVIGRDGQKEVLSASGRKIDLPLVVLVNGGSASAAEILAGAIQDYQMGKLVGTRTFGKGSVQTLFQLSNGSVLKLTTARYHTATGRVVDGNGLIPDYQIESAEQQLSYAEEILETENQRLIVLRPGKKEVLVGEVKKVALKSEPYLWQGHLLVPLQFTDEVFGAVVNRDQKANKVTLSYGSQKIVLQPGKDTVTINGRPVLIAAPVIEKKQEVFIPVRLISEAFGATVNWEKDSKKVIIECKVN